MRGWLSTKDRCECIGNLTGGGYEKMLEADRRVYSADGLAPTIRTVTGGNKEIVVAIDSKEKSDLSSRKYYVCENGDVIKARKLTPRECYRLMGFSDADFDNAKKYNTDNNLYKQAGNSIVVDVLMAIFGEML